MMIPLLFSLVVLAAPPPAPRAPRDVVEVLLSLPEDTGPFVQLPVEARRKALAARTTIVDTKNGFVRFSSDWVPEGQPSSRTFQVAIFMRRDKTFIVGVSNSDGDRLDGARTSIAFYEYVNGAWAECFVLPSLEFKDFWVPRKRKPPALVESFLVNWDLPQHGTTLTATLNPFVRRSFDDGMQDVTTRDSEAANKAAETEFWANTRTVSLVWDARAGLFTRK